MIAPYKTTDEPDQEGPAEVAPQEISQLERLRQSIVKAAELLRQPQAQNGHDRGE